MFETRVLGVDPGVASLGIAVVHGNGRSASLIWSDTLRTEAGGQDADRLRRVCEGIREAIAAHAPAAVAIERLAWNRNQVSAIAVARATGAVMVAAAEAGLPVTEYGPNEVKIAVTGMGNADKEQVRRALTKVHGLSTVPDQADAADAVAVALTHLVGSRMGRLARTGSP
jgi:crossover junction endodeoxyribonuclease RuvC